MRPRILVISCPGRTSRFLILSRRVLIGQGPENGFIVCHPSLPREGVQISDVDAGPPHGGDRDPAMPDTKDRRASWEWGDLSISIRPIPWRRVALAGLAGVLALFLTLRAATRPEPGQDWSPIPLPAQGPFGFCRQDRTHPRGVRFSLPDGPASGDILEFVLGGGEADGTASLTLDGRIVRDGIGLVPGWGESIQVALTADDSLSAGGLIEIRPSFDRGPARPWGVRDIRLLHASGGNPAGGGAAKAAETILADPLADGPDLAACYARLGRIASSAPAEEAALAVRLETRMGTILRGELCRARALALVGKSAEARRLREKLSSWVPPAWIEGREILGGAGS